MHQPTLISTDDFTEKPAIYATPIEVPMRVHAYRNLHRIGYFSVVAREGPLRDRVIGHARTLILAEPVFYVSQKRRERVVATRQRARHAWVLGLLVYTSDEPDYPVPAGFRHATYNPFKYTSFIDTASGERVEAAEVAILTGSTVFYR